MFDVSQAIVDEIIKYDKIDCPFTLSNSVLEFDLRTVVSKDFKSPYELPVLWRLHKESYSPEDFPVYEFQIFSLKRLVWETTFIKLTNVGNWKKYFEGEITIDFNRGSIQYDTIIENAKKFLTKEINCTTQETETI